ncbi:hypothetical protein L210DRAFT_3507776 [Boletus edulis BED1]|uniref:Uncharacterized protein n=1 Tax=Boletus edulis BED1 TaxID=1328754 RepID=A0AAD4GA77_BOLED|nr:hypothetical protein L210DRAFT_3507776 [Boletus edulis BED1]
MPNKLYRLSRTWGKGVLLSCQWWWWWWDEEEHALHRRDLVVTRWLGQISQCLCCPKDAKCQEEKGSLDDLEEVDSEEIEGQVDDLAGKLLDSCPKNDLALLERKLKPMRSKVEVFTREELLPENTTIKKGEKAAKPRQWLHKSKVAKVAGKVEKLLDEVVIELQKLISGALNNEKERQRFAGAIKGEHFPCLLGKHIAWHKHNWEMAQAFIEKSF